MLTFLLFVTGYVCGQAIAGILLYLFDEQITAFVENTHDRIQDWFSRKKG